MASNIKGLDTVESKWVASAMGFILGNDVRPGICPSEPAWDRFQTNLVNAGIEKVRIPYTK